MLSAYAANRHHKQERTVLQQADISLVTADYWPALYAKRGAKRVEVLLNGYDETDFSENRPALSAYFVISHVGTLAYDRNPTALWQALKELTEASPAFAEDLQLHFAGKTDHLVLKYLGEMGMGHHIVDRGYITHQEAIDMMCTSPILLLLINQATQNAQGRVPGKVFEYLAARRPILCIGPEESSISRILADSQAGTCFDFEDKENIKQSVWTAYEHSKQELCSFPPRPTRSMHGKPLTEKLGHFLDEITG